jgi:hypothetical protein
MLDSVLLLEADGRHRDLSSGACRLGRGLVAVAERTPKPEFEAFARLTEI